MQPLKLPMIKKSHDAFGSFIIYSLLPFIPIFCLHVTIIYLSKIKFFNVIYIFESSLNQAGWKSRKRKYAFIGDIYVI